MMAPRCVTPSWLGTKLVAMMNLSFVCVQGAKVKDIT